MKKKARAPGFPTFDLSKMVVAERKYHTKPRPIGGEMFAFEIITVNSRQWIGPGPDGTTESIDLPPILWWCLPQGIPVEDGACDHEWREAVHAATGCAWDHVDRFLFCMKCRTAKEMDK